MNEQTQTAPAQSFPAITMAKNGVTMTLEPIEETRGKGKGKLYIGSKSSFDLQQSVAIMGETFVTDLLNNRIKAHLKECDYEAAEKVTRKNEKGEEITEIVSRDPNKFKANWETWTFTSESIKVLSEKRLKLMMEFVELPDDNSPAIKERQASLKSQIAAFNLTIERKSRSKDDPDDDEPETVVK